MACDLILLGIGVAFVTLVTHHSLEGPRGPEDYWESSDDNLTGNPTNYGQSNKLSAASMTVTQWDNFYFRSGARSGY